MDKNGLLNELKAVGAHCSGCAACCNGCPVDAITMEPDSLGFLQPQINEKICIDCGRCKDICPGLQAKNTEESVKEFPLCYAAKGSDELRQKSSSGGAFTLLAQEILRRGGIVFGAVMGTDLTVYHTAARNEDELAGMRKSKYVQSTVGYTYRDVKNALDEGRDVLFSGTPCQVAGLYAFLGEKPKRLYTIDIFCHGVSSSKMLKESLQELRGNPCNIDFRDKNYGWECLAMTVYFTDGSKRRLSYDESRYEQGLHPGMTLRESCYECSFCDFPRQGDISIGDFWRLDDYRPELVDGKGVSALLVNTEKGADLFDKVKETFAHVTQTPIEWLSHNRISAQTRKDPAREYFLELYPGHTFNRSVYLAQQGKYDVGIVGNWSYPNYGSALTYYALYRIIKEQGLSVCMMSWPQTSEWRPYAKADLFLKEPYRSFEMATVPQTREELFVQGDKCGTFVLGSDQLLNNNLYRWFDRFAQLDWVPAYKRKIAYAASFGCDYIWGEERDHAEMAHFLRQFDAFSVREETGQTLLKQNYGVEAQTVLDPVFLLPKEELYKLADIGMARIPNDRYLFAYVLDPNSEKAAILRSCGEKLGILPYSVSDAAPHKHQLGEGWDIQTEYGIKLEEWLAVIRGCSFMITDSFHGMCMAIRFHKPFLAISNQERGATRFAEILGKLGLTDRLLSSVRDISQKTELLGQPIDYEIVEKRLSTERGKSLLWLQNALTMHLPPKEATDYDLLSRKINGLHLKSDETDAKQWAQLEDHRMRLDGVDARMQAVEETDTKQWTQLEDHRMRLDGIDARIQLEEENDKTQRQQLEEYRLRLESACGQISELELQLKLANTRIEKLEEQIQELIRCSLLYRIRNNKKES